MKFVPKQSVYEATPCHHIPLNNQGETVDSLYRTGTNEEIEEVLQNWLLDAIQQLEETRERRWLQTAAKAA